MTDRRVLSARLATLRHDLEVAGLPAESITLISTDDGAPACPVVPATPQPIGLPFEVDDDAV